MDETKAWFLLIHCFQTQINQKLFLVFTTPSSQKETAINFSTIDLLSQRSWNFCYGYKSKLALCLFHLHHYYCYKDVLWIINPATRR